MIIRKYETYQNDGVLELVKESEKRYEGTTNNPEEIKDMLNGAFRHGYRSEEIMHLVCFNTKMCCVGVFEIGHGTTTASLCNPKDIFKKALMVNAEAIVIVHNHPSGSTEPSKDDVKLTKKVKLAGEFIGIELLDHIIVANDDYFSFMQNDIL